MTHNIFTTDKIKKIIPAKQAIFTQSNKDHTKLPPWTAAPINNMLLLFLYS